MLFNPTWAKTPSLEGFIAWLETKDPEERYDWLSFNTCACGQYLRSLDLEIPTKYPDAGYAGVADRLSAIARCNGISGSWTFGNALRSARKVKASKSATYSVRTAAYCRALGDQARLG